MKYSLANPKEALAAMAYLERLALKDRNVEIKKIDDKRSHPQNNYLHLILSIFGNHFGYSLEEVKQDIFKRDVCKDIFLTKKLGRTIYKSTADISREQMTAAIDRFRMFSGDLGLDLPLPTDEALLNYMHNELERSKYHLR